MPAVEYSLAAADRSARLRSDLLSGPNEYVKAESMVNPPRFTSDLFC